MKYFLLLTLLISFNLFGFPKIPNKDISPGDLCTLTDRDFKERRYPEQIIYCQRNVSNSKKNKIYNAYKIPVSERKQYTIDHIIPLSIGGSNSEKNLWPEHLSIKAERGTLEFDLYDSLRKADITQIMAIEAILTSKFGE